MLFIFVIVIASVILGLFLCWDYPSECGILLIASTPIAGRRKTKGISAFIDSFFFVDWVLIGARATTAYTAGPIRLHVRGDVHRDHRLGGLLGVPHSGDHIHIEDDVLQVRAAKPVSQFSAN